MGLHRSAPPAFADLEIRIFPRQEQGYPVEITFGRQVVFPRGLLSTEVGSWVPAGSPRDDGRQLSRLLFRDPAVAAAWIEARASSPRRRVRLRLEPSTPELHVLPWELLEEPDAAERAVPLAADRSTPFCRYLGGISRCGPVEEPPFRVLVAVASPAGLDEYDLDPLDVEAEEQALREAIAGLGRGQLELGILPPPVTLRALEERLGEGYHALHLMAHGVLGRRCEQAALLLAGEDGRVRPTTDRDFADMVQRLGGDLRLVFLASCHSAAVGPHHPSQGLAPLLIGAGVPAVLAMRDRIAIGTAREFACTFYRRLTHHGSVDLAANEARSLLVSARLPGTAIPALFLSGGPRLLARPARPPRLRRFAAVVAALALGGVGLWRGLGVVREVEAVHQREIADRLAFEARGHLGVDPAIALLLGLEASRRGEGEDRRDGLLAALASVDHGLGRVVARHGGMVTGVAFSPDGRLLASSSRSRDGTTGAVLLTEPTLEEGRSGPLYRGAGIAHLGFSPDGRTLVALDDEHRMHLWDMARDPPQMRLAPNLGGAAAFAFAPGGDLLAVGDESGTILLWSLSGPEAASPMPRVRAHEGAVSCLSFSPDGRALASGGVDGRVHLWVIRGGPASGRAILAPAEVEPGALSAAVAALVFAVGGEVLVGVAADGHVQPWRTSNGEAYGDRLDSYLHGVRAAALGPEGRLFALGSNDGRLLLSDVARRARLGAPLAGHTGAILAIAFHPRDADTLVTGGADGVVLLWNLRLEALRSAACRLAGRNLSRDEWQRFVGEEEPYRATCVELPVP